MSGQAPEICNFGAVFTTSGFIRELDLHLLEDDREFFAVYNSALTVRQDVFEQYRQLRKIFVPISKELDTETLRKLNYAVDVQGESPERCARTWLTKNEFSSSGPLWCRVMRRVSKHHHGTTRGCRIIQVGVLGEEANDHGVRPGQQVLCGRRREQRARQGGSGATGCRGRQGSPGRTQ